MFTRPDGFDFLRGWAPELRRTSNVLDAAINLTS